MSNAKRKIAILKISYLKGVFFEKINKYIIYEKDIHDANVKGENRCFIIV